MIPWDAITTGFWMSFAALFIFGLATLYVLVVRAWSREGPIIQFILFFLIFTTIASCAYGFGKPLSDDESGDEVKEKPLHGAALIAHEKKEWSDFSSAFIFLTISGLIAIYFRDKKIELPWDAESGKVP